MVLLYPRTPIQPYHRKELHTAYLRLAGQLVVDHGGHMKLQQLNVLLQHVLRRTHALLTLQLIVVLQ